MLNHVSRWLRQQKGQDLTEYALIIGLIVLLAVGAIQLMGTSIQGILQAVSDTLEGVLT